MTDATIRNITLFADLPSRAMHDIQDLCQWRRFVAGDVVFDRENYTLDVYFVVAGSVRILNIAAGNRDVALADISAGNYFGELAAIDGLRRSARVIALEDTLLASLKGPDFLELMQTYPVISLKVLERLTRIVRDLDRRVTLISGQNENQRIWSQLMHLAEPNPPGEEWIIRDLPNHKEIAAWSGTTREQVAQAIGELARDHIVRRRGMSLIIGDRPRLQKMVGRIIE
ncbi:MAG: Crp/Fnr family transcriptional regulator [Alphaproteobacteria bacterium]|nr:Crp/Fnr family transcriptional regulator [Alphaproteobacteria bacterium]